MSPGLDGHISRPVQRSEIAYGPQRSTSVQSLEHAVTPPAPASPALAPSPSLAPTPALAPPAPAAPPVCRRSCLPRFFLRRLPSRSCRRCQPPHRPRQACPTHRRRWSRRRPRRRLRPAPKLPRPPLRIACVVVVQTTCPQAGTELAAFGSIISPRRGAAWHASATRAVSRRTRSRSRGRGRCRSKRRSFGRSRRL